MAPLSAPIKRICTRLVELGNSVLQTRQVACIQYHRVTKAKFTKQDYQPNSGLFTHVANLDEQLDYLNKSYNCISLEDLQNAFESHSLPKNGAMVTFDDGYTDNLELALPLLEKYEVPATIFISPNLVEGTADVWWLEVEHIIKQVSNLKLTYSKRELEWKTESVIEKEKAARQLSDIFRSGTHEDHSELLQQLRLLDVQPFSYDGLFLSWDDIKQLDQHPLITIGAHTTSHRILAHLSQSELKDELARSKSILEDKLGHSIDSLCYPYGQLIHCSDREFQEAEKAGFTLAFTSRFGVIQRHALGSPHALPRLFVDYFDNLDEFRYKASGLAPWRHMKLDSA